MAKGKHAAALFEVIHGNKNIDTRGGSALRTPKWWFKGRPEAEVPGPVATAPAPTPMPAQTRPGYVAPRIAAVEEMPPAPTAPSPAPQASRFRNEQTSAASRSTGRPGRPMHFDGDRHEVTMRVRYTTAIVGGFALLVAVGVAYVIGRHVAGGPQTAAASGVVVPATAGEDADRHVVNSNALEVPRHPKPLPPSASPRGNDNARPRETARKTNSESNPGTPIAPAVPTPATPEGQRAIGLNYVIAQSYPDIKSANEARDFLVKSGIGCTVVQGPRDFTHESWFSVVGTRGFDHIHTPECDAYVKAIEKSNDRFAAGSRFKRFEPHLYRWK
ncbi:MAG TPA: hypothetical protein VG269_25010 [Tepidisphaeraceae bacterium]|jgi:hypothetical protein|nr:hypothetical protein [Tepidisphaeraceae bacterium]